MNMFSRSDCMKLLARCMDLFQPENCALYVQFSPEGKMTNQLADPAQIPSSFPENYEQMVSFSGKIYDAMLRLDLPQENLAYPKFEEMVPRLDELNFEECAQFLLFYNRANLKYGQAFFYKTWHNGVVLRVVRRMVATAENYIFPEERTQPHYEPASIALITGDICAIKADCIVNPTDEKFSGSGGIDKLIHSKAGPELRDACKTIGTLPAGTAARSKGFLLSADAIIHASIPKKDQKNAAYLLASCYVNCLELSKHATSVALPALGSSSVGFTPEEALRIGAYTVWHWCQKNPGPLQNISFVFTSEEKKLLFRNFLIECVIQEFRQQVSPAALAVSLRHTLPWFFEERGGLVQLPPEKKALADQHREAYYDLHHRYSKWIIQMYLWIGSPHYSTVVDKALKRNGAGSNSYIPEFMKYLDGMTLEECICFLVMLQRDDYASGGTSATHLKQCANGNVARVLEHMEKLLRGKKD